MIVVENNLNKTPGTLHLCSRVNINKEIKLCVKDYFICEPYSLSSALQEKLLVKFLRHNHAPTIITFADNQHKFSSGTTLSLEVTKEMSFFKNYAENETGRLVPVSFCFFKKV